MEKDLIIKALECHANGCKCSQCPMPKRTKEHHSCWTELSQATLSFIKELIEENERLEDNLIKQSTENIMLLIERQEIKADTVRKMQERLTTFFAADDTLKHIEVDAEYINSRIDLIAKELEGI